MLTRMMDGVNMVIRIPCCLVLQGAYCQMHQTASLQNVTRPAVCTASGLFMKTLQQIVDLQVFNVASHEYQAPEHASKRVRSRCESSAVTY